MRPLKRSELLHLVLVHYPVLNRKGEVIASAFTNLDLHDLARLTRTYAMPACYIVTPLADQRALMKELIDHWCEGAGRELHPNRREALMRLRIADAIASVREEIEAQFGKAPRIWATSARRCHGTLACGEARHMLARSDGPHLLLLGTGWGLAPSVMEAADAVLEPIAGLDGYNHLSVRCAAAIMVDRLLSEDGSQ